MPSSKIDRLQVNESGFAFDPQTGSTFSLNETGLKIVGLLRAGKSRDQVAARLAKDFDLDLSSAANDVDDFLLALKGLDLA